MNPTAITRRGRIITGILVVINGGLAVATLVLTLWTYSNNAPQMSFVVVVFGVVLTGLLFLITIAILHHKKWVRWFFALCAIVAIIGVGQSLFDDLVRGFSDGDVALLLSWAVALGVTMYEWLSYGSLQRELASITSTPNV